MKLNDQNMRAILALSTIVGFFGLVFITLVGFVNIADPVLAKIIGTLIGYVTALMNPIIRRYFNADVGGPPEL